MGGTCLSRKGCISSKEAGVATLERDRLRDVDSGAPCYTAYSVRESSCCGVASKS